MLGMKKYFLLVLLFCTVTFVLPLGYAAYDTYFASMSGDLDGDGYVDGIDKCPIVMNPNNTFNGLPNCMDADNDGFEDSLRDICPGQAGSIYGCPTFEATTVQVAPSCTVPTLVEQGDSLLIQIKGTTYVSEPITVDE